MSQVTASAEATDIDWKPLYRIAAVAALITVVLIPIQVVLFIVWPPPLEGTVNDWFALFEDNRLHGLLSLDLLLMFDYVLLIPIVLALYVALRGVEASFTAIGAVLFFVAIAVYFASNTAFEMLSLSEQYTAATTAAERTTLLAAGQAMLATYTGTAFHASYILGSLAGITLSAVMLRGETFSRAAAYAGILGNAIGLGLYLPAIGLYLGVLSGPILWIWYILLARRFFQMP
jgi:hypothetical protein